jgi:two-component system nitrate/nitrite response regulator NarL
LASDLVHTALVGGDPLFQEGLRRILRDTRYATDLIATSLDDALRYGGRLDLFIILAFPDSDPDVLDAVGAARANWPDARIVAIAEDGPRQLIAALNAGVHGYLGRGISAESFPRFLSLIMLGQRIFSMRSLNLPMDLPDLMPNGNRSQETLAERIDEGALTQRERELLNFLVEGRSNKVIARNLDIAEATVKAQMGRLIAKIGAANRTQAAVMAWTSQQNLISPQ